MVKHINQMYKTLGCSCWLTELLVITEPMIKSTYDKRTNILIPIMFQINHERYHRNSINVN